LLLFEVDSSVLRVAHIVPRTEAEGPGTRLAVWVQGCTIRCPGCCNPELFGREGGREVDVETLATQVQGTAGITFLGGEPLDQAASVTALAAAVRRRGLSVLVFSGYLRDDVDRRAPDLLRSVDVLVDGPFDPTQPERGAPRPRRWVGSRNQRLHFLTDRYGPTDFQGANTVELRLSGGVLTVNGWPAPRAAPR